MYRVLVRHGLVSAIARKRRGEDYRRWERPEPMQLWQLIQSELLDPHGPLDSPDAAQTAVDAWRVEYNTVRPHQSLNMATPAERFRAVPVKQRAVLGLWRPPELAPTGSGTDSTEPIDDEPDEPVAAADLVLATDASTIAQPAWTPSTRRSPSMRGKSTG